MPHTSPRVIVSKHRLEALSDGVFAVVMTLLVLELKPEHLPATASNAEVWAALSHLVRPIAGYAITFALTGMFWLLQHRTLSLLSHSTRRHAFLTLAFLFAVSLLPLSISLWMPSLGRPAGFAIYYTNFALIAVALLAGWLDARRSGLTDGDPDQCRELTIRLASIAVAAIGGAVFSLVRIGYGELAVIAILLAGRGYARTTRRGTTPAIQPGN